MGVSPMILRAEQARSSHGQDARATNHTGKMPVSQTTRARCPCHEAGLSGMITPMAKDQDKPHRRTWAPTITNRKAWHRYTVLEKIEAGIALVGTEVKSVRNSEVSLDEAFARIENGQAWLVGCHIKPYPYGDALRMPDPVPPPSPAPPPPPDQRPGRRGHPERHHARPAVDVFQRRPSEGGDRPGPRQGRIRQAPGHPPKRAAPRNRPGHAAKTVSGGRSQVGRQAQAGCRPGGVGA